MPPSATACLPADMHLDGLWESRSGHFPAGQGRLYLVILHTLQGQLVAVHPQRVAQDRDAVALLQLEDLKPNRKRDGALWA